MKAKSKSGEQKLSSSLEFLTEKLTLISTADEKSLPSIYQEIEQKAKNILELLDKSPEGKELKSQKLVEFKAIHGFLSQVVEVRQEKRKRSAESKGAKVFGGLGGAIGGGTIASVIGGGQTKVSTPSGGGYGSSGSSSGSSSTGWKLGGIF